jgi:signal transduction histidine kinase/ActR/RegA family two-component response regulator
MLNQQLLRPYLWSVIVAGGGALLFSAVRFDPGIIDARLLVLTALTLFVTSRIAINVPGDSAKISVSDTFVFLTFLLYGGEAAIFVAAGEGLASSMYMTRKAMTRLLNTAMLAASTFLTVWSLRFLFGRDIQPAEGFTASFVTAVCLMAIIQYVANSAAVAIGTALKSQAPVWQTYYKYYLWTSLTYVAGASAAAIISRLMLSVGDYAVLAATPIIVILYFTYRTYLQNVEAAAAQAEQAERHVEELNHYIAEQERIREQFTQIEKLSALGELASGVAHDFNNTLAGILGRAQLLLRTNDPEKIRRGLQVIIKTAEDGARTVRRIQDFARQRRDHDFEPIAVDQLLFDVSEITRPRWKDRGEAAGVPIRLALRIRTDAHVLGDGSELREILVNMVFNAVDAMPHGGTLTLAADDCDEGVEISVSDDGVGMTPEVRSRVFDPFFTTKGKAGLGLGLAVSYGIVRRHNGQIEVDSVPGKGSTFRIQLPAADLTARENQFNAEAGESGVGEERVAGPLRLLVVDDEATVRDLLCDILTCEGYEVTPAGSGAEALALFDASNFDAVFTDIGMPGMSGWELAHAIRERRPSLPLGVITGWGEAVGSVEQRAAQVNWVVTKPFGADRILEMAREVSYLTANASASASAPRLRVVA